MERTHLNQADEALRQAAPATDKAPTILTAIADRLTAERPTEPMTEARRTALALTYATDGAAGGFRSDEADALDIALLDLMPRIDRPITRGEYALLLRAAAAGGTG